MRLREGRVYPPERIDAALNNFFTIENLVALREVALRQVAESVGAQRIAYAGAVGTREESLQSAATQAVGDRLLALVEPNPRAQRLVRRAWRSAARLGADLDVLWVRSSRDMSDEDERGLAALRQLVSLLGAELHVIDSDDIERAVAEFVAERGTTYVLMGRPRPASGLGRLREPLPMRLMRAPRGRRRARRRRPRPATGARGMIGGVVLVVCGVAARTGRRLVAAAARATGPSPCSARRRAADPAARSTARASRAARWMRRCASRSPRTRR